MANTTKINMANNTSRHSLVTTVLATALLFIGLAVRADEGGLDVYVGRWDVHVKTLRPQKSEVSYVEVYEWVLDHKFLRGQTGGKPDGTEDVIYATYDQQAKGYPFWIFSSSGSYSYLPPATWDVRKRTMEWSSPKQWVRQWNISFRGRCDFPDEQTRHCTFVTKDWKGAVLLEQEFSAVRRDD